MKLRFGILIVFLLAASGCATVQPMALNRAFSDDLEEARKLVSSGHLKQAVDDLTQLIDMDRKNTEARFLRAVAYQGLEQFESAVQDYASVLALNPNSAKAEYNLGMIFAYKLMDPRRALEHFDRFLSLETNHENAFSVAKIMCSIDASRRGSELEDKGLPDILSQADGLSDPVEKKKKLQEAAQLNPGSPVPLYMLGKMFEEEGKKDEAIRIYEEAIEIRPTCAPCHQALGNLLILKKRQDEGQRHLAKAKLFDPNGSPNGSEDGEANPL